MQDRKLCALLVSAMIVVILALSPTFLSLITRALMNSVVVVNNTGQISLHSITAKSGSPADIQAAVNTIAAAGGGNVSIPGGTFTFNPPMNGIGVTIPYVNVPINIIGAGIGVTILRETVNPGGSSMFSRVWSGQNYNGAAVRISGISFVGFVVDESVTSNVAITIFCTQDFRIDHCSFQDFAGMAIFTADNTGGTYKLVDRGVIDHCSFDNPYKAVLQPHNATGAYYSVWGYGIVIVGVQQPIGAVWDPNIQDYLGQYYNTTTYNGYPIPSPIYIENCNFTRMRHAISANGGGYYVSRYNYFQESAPYGQNDAHGNQGGTPGFGTRALESYSNIFNFTDESYSQGQDYAVEMRGGGGVCWNNTVILLPGSNTHTLALMNDGESPPYDVEQFYIWNNTAMYTNGTLADFNSLVSNQAGYAQNVNYFLRAPSQTLDGFTYAPFTYPHPLTL